MSHKSEIVNRSRLPSQDPTRPAGIVNRSSFPTAVRVTTTDRVCPEQQVSLSVRNIIFALNGCIARTAGGIIV
ncbi:MAG: hypothetical protein ACM3P1_09270 [Candidatus Saccharibacteria bacterium]